LQAFSFLIIQLLSLVCAKVLNDFDVLW